MREDSNITLRETKNQTHEEFKKEESTKADVKKEDTKKDGLKRPENNVIKIIQKEWVKEVERLDSKKNGQKGKSQTSDSKLKSTQPIRIDGAKWSC